MHPVAGLCNEERHGDVRSPALPEILIHDTHVRVEPVLVEGVKSLAETVVVGGGVTQAQRELECLSLGGSTKLEMRFLGHRVQQCPSIGRYQSESKRTSLDLQLGACVGVHDTHARLWVAHVHGFRR